MYTMNALEKALQTNPTPLLLFASFKDFSGENISFLTHVKKWRENWDPKSARAGFARPVVNGVLSEQELRRKQFSTAVGIFSSFVSLQHADFPVNLSSAHLKELETLFAGPATMVTSQLQDNTVAPFDDFWAAPSPRDVENSPIRDHMSVSSTAVDSLDGSYSPAKQAHGQITAVKIKEIADKIPDYVPIPETFGPHVFDNAEASIKYMVLTNTWAKFVNAGFASRQGNRSGLSNIQHAFEELTNRWVEGWAKMKH